MKYLLILTLIATQAYATNKPEPPDDPPIEQTVEQSQTQDMEQNQQQTFTAGDDSATGGSAEATGGTGGNVGDVQTNVETSINYKRPYRNAPNAYAPPVSPTVSCFKGASGSASAPGFGISIGAGKIDQGCVRRELIRLAPESHKLFLFCNEPTVLAMFDDFDTCLDYDPKGGDDSNDGGYTLPTPTYDDTSLREEIKAALSDVREELRQTNVKVGVAQKRSATPRPDPYADMQARVQARTEYIE